MVLRIPFFEADQEPYAGFCGPNKKAGFLGARLVSRMDPSETNLSNKKCDVEIKRPLLKRW